MLISHDIVSDTCYVLSFAIIMLNTSLHNPSVKDKPTVDRFVAMNRGINEGGDLPRELLEVFSTRRFVIHWKYWHCWHLHTPQFLPGSSLRVNFNQLVTGQLSWYVFYWCLSTIFLMFNQDLYNNIKKEPFKIPEDDGNDLMHTFFNPVKEGWLCKQGIYAL